jgi:hypothetical protein
VDPAAGLDDFKGPDVADRAVEPGSWLKETPARGDTGASERAIQEKGDV